ncbi:MAG: DNA-formamidopyrimidine glycosylase family protein, partial [Acidimicrobiales bacterium]
MPELPEMQALAERLDEVLATQVLDRCDLLGFSSLKTFSPPVGELYGTELRSVGRRGKYLVMTFESNRRILIHLSQGGRIDVEAPPKATRPRGALARLFFGDLALLVREHGNQRKAGWWVLEVGDDGPLGTLGPEPTDSGFEELLLADDSPRHIHTLLRDQHFVAGIGRGYADDTLNRARLSPFAPLRSLSEAERKTLVSTARQVLAEALERERHRPGGLSDARLGERFAVHNRSGLPCPACGAPLASVRFDSYEIVY